MTVDPGSPSGKEYALPLQSARRAAAPAPPSQGDGSAPAGSAARAPLFGAGISSPRARTTPFPRGRTTQVEDQRPSQPHTPAYRARRHPSTAAAPAAVRLAAQTPGAPSGGLGTDALVGGAGVAVLLAGAVGGILLRRRVNRS